MIFLVENAAGGGHPLDVAGTDDPAVARRILMLDLAVIDDGDRLEPAMRMLADAAPLGCRREIMRPRIRSEEHTSELQSLMRISYAVSCLKKKNHIQTRIHVTDQIITS